jgi:hypothetical protein
MVSQLGSDVASAAIFVLFFGLVGWMLYRCWRTVSVGQEGIITLSGHYVRTIGPGRRFVNPHFGFGVVPAGYTARFHLGEGGTVVGRVGGRNSPGRVRVGAEEFPATAWRELSVGTPVRVGSVDPTGILWVVRVRERPASAGTSVSKPLR